MSYKSSCNSTRDSCYCHDCRKHMGVKRQMKKGMKRIRRRLEKLDPENAPVKNQYYWSLW